MLVDRVIERQSNRRTIDFRILLSFKSSIDPVRRWGYCKENSKTANEKGVKKDFIENYSVLAEN